MNTPHTAGTNQTKGVAAFLGRVAPWPADSEPGYINLHYVSVRAKGLPGRPYKTLVDFMEGVDWFKLHPSFASDIYFCLSRQRDIGKVINNRAYALRNKDGAMFLKAIWLDVDVKAPPKGYADVAEALQAIQKFVTDAKLPLPSALVGSGSGIHCYWISDRPLTPLEWSHYADGLRNLTVKHKLRCDSSVTIDCARVLRVPGTFNYKTMPPRPVDLLGPLAEKDIDFEKELGHIRSQHVNATRVGKSGGSKASVVDTCPGLTPRQQDPYLLTAQYQKEIGEVRPDILPIDPIIRGCPFLADALMTGGRDHDQGLWMMTGLASTFFENGRAVFHALSKGHADYNEANVDAMFDRKEDERAEKGLGWPSCQTFEKYGSEQCAGCQHKNEIKSPLNLADRVRPKSVPSAEDSITRQVKEGKIHPVVALKMLHQRRANNDALFAVLNENYAVVRYGSEIVVATIFGNEVITMKVENFHRMFANVRIQVGLDSVEVSRLWFKWPGRRQYLDRGVVFLPGRLPDVAEDMLNLWRGFGIEPKQGDWTLMRNHIFNVVCSKHQDLFDYLIRWLACAVQRPNEPIGVAVAFRGAPGAGKGIVARTLGKIFGKHFAHIANGDQLTGRFNASLATSCVVFLDEALWAGDKKGEGVLKALITEPRLSLEAKFRDPIMVDNRLRIIVASNEDWVVPTGMGDRRWFILDVANTFAGTGHKDYWDPLYAEVENGGASAMFYDLLAMNLSGFDVRAVPHTAAKAQQQAHTLRGTDAWLYHVLQEGCIGSEPWENNGLSIATDHAYACYEDFSKRQHAWRPEIKAVWSKKVRSVLGQCVEDTRQTTGNERIRSFKFAPLADCRRQFATHSGAPNIEWEADNEPESELGASPLKANAVTAADANPPPQSAPNKTAVSGWRETL